MDQSNFMIACDRALHLTPYWLIALLCIGGLTRLAFKNFSLGAALGFIGFPFLLLLFY
ncbi:hypothetical protein PSP6_690126 [Paraburkholderia tropica]|uniref:hypothetical protein n=1 Tax=Paraburkholderia tropica TaxID=92647 RepID=UPI001CAFF7A4|nr:hypothetical protein [Paraburkholderia tropica]CAG9236024.1 hypothetical protein PSP6_690126 [Paraburkholderia tropica]